MSRRKLVVGNWKMNGMRAHLDEVEAIGKVAAQHPAVEVGLCLPATLIMAGSQLRGAAFIGAQNCHMELSGAYTGSLSAEMLIEAGATWVITGHSERREARVRGQQAVALVGGEHVRVPLQGDQPVRDVRVHRGEQR